MSSSSENAIHVPDELDDEEVFIPKAKEDLLPKPEAARVKQTRTTPLNLTFRCGECHFYRNSAHPRLAKPCQSLGVNSAGSAPSCFSPNLYALKDVSKDTLQTIFHLCSTLRPAQLKALAGLMSRPAVLARHDLSFLEEVFFCVGDDYLDNYVRAYALTEAPSGGIMLVGSTFFTEFPETCAATILRSSLMTRAQFVRKRRELQDAGKLHQPRKAIRNENLAAIDYEPPTIESDESTVGQSRPNSPRRKKSSPDQTTPLIIREEEDNQEDIVNTSPIEEVEATEADDQPRIEEPDLEAPWDETED